MPYSVGPILAGVDLTKVDSSRQFPLGAVAFADDGSMYQYVQNNLSGTATRFASYIMDESFKLTAAVSHSGGGSGAAPLNVGMPQTSETITDQYYVWVLRKGPGFCRTSGAVAADVKLYTSATAGDLDDASTSQTLISGLYLTAAVTASTTAAACFANIEMSINCDTKASAS